MAKSKTTEEIQEILSRVCYRDWSFVLEERHPYGTAVFSRMASAVGLRLEPTADLVLRVQFLAPDNVVGGKYVLQKGRKWFLSRYSTPSEIVQTAWAAVARAEMHEVAEQFLYRGVPIFNRHVDVDAMVDAAGRIDVRD